MCRFRYMEKYLQIHSLEELADRFQDRCREEYMALQFVFGGSGSGKSHYLYQRIIQEAGEHPALNYMVLVPEQFTMQTQKDLVLMNEKKGIMNIDGLSFGRLAYRIF